MRFYRTPAILPFFYPSLLWRVKTSEKEIYLTFDDGPVPGPTDFVLDTLRSFNATGTFFCIGDNIRKHPAEFEKVIGGGHATGNHTFNHLNGWKTSPSSYVENVVQCQKRLSNGNLFRPPFGRIRNSQIHALKDFKIVMWDVLTFDYDRTLAPEKCLRGSIEATRPGSIIVFHDSIKAGQNLRYVLPRFIEAMLSKGYVFKQLS
ncbi:MAG TPA: polysaccharide deacetylase family protein [Cyclobacteriaceae bacterium]|nr:polysaccharide deacetylase family protein [Cyclobacteriaceae bacterium]